MPELENKVALVTGGGQGIGRGIALALAKAGARVIVAQRNFSKVKAVKAEIDGLGQEALALPLDVTDTASIHNCVEESHKHFRQIDILVNNAGVGQQSYAMATNRDEFNRCLDANFKSIWDMTTAFLSDLKENNGGKIINIASIEGRQGTAIQPAYSASKAAAISLTQSFAANLGPDGINVNAVCPGPVWTPQQENYQRLASQRGEIEPDKVNENDFFKEHVAKIPLRRVATPEDIGNAVVFLASSRAKNITGQALNVDGGIVMN